MANYDQPSYLTRQMEVIGRSAAGANGTSLVQGFPTGMRIRRFCATVITAGTTTGASIGMYSLTGTATTSLGSIVLGTTTANTVVQGTDVNSLLPVGSVLFFVNGADATVVTSPCVEYTLDAQFGTFAGP